MISLSRLHGKKTAVFIPIQDRCVRLVGQGASENDPQLGDIVRISSEEGVDIIIQIATWEGVVASSTEADCDFTLRLAAGSLPPSR